MAHIIRKATRDHPDHRYQTVGELVDALKAYQSAKDPKSHPVGAFEAAISRVEERMRRREYRESEVKELLNVFTLLDARRDAGQLLDMFDRIPGDVLRICAKHFPDELQPALEAYVAAIDENVREQPFSYAESVANDMQRIFYAPGANPELKALALEATLMAAVRLNRYAAIDRFNAMIRRRRPQMS